jgi:hypothetical protein
MRQNQQGRVASKAMARGGDGASSLFMPESLAANMVPKFREGLGRLQAFFERIIDGHSACRKASGSARRPISTANASAANSSGGCRLDSARRSEGHGNRDAPNNRW